MNLEVIITFKHAQYEAKCPSYPHCKGLGESKVEAMHKLTDSISRQVQRSTKKELTSLFKTSRFSNVLNLSENSKDQEHRIYPIDESSGSSCLKDIHLKFHELPEMKYFPDKSLKTPSVNDFFEALKSETLPLSDLPLKESSISILDAPFKTRDDGFIFGVPLSLN
jgi:hypothetical protein